VFSHSSRWCLLERAALGVSRAALRQQESKVAVGPLRQRMAALRGRAVELVGEAFSGGAADPTALQLQADELYGMEEALAARVNQAFRAQKWDERLLQCVKAVVRREQLLADAAAVMKHYANDVRVNCRRLEVRFEGESGFDAASGEEAGVTRGFYADVAEALLSCEHVCGVFNSSALCPKNITGEVPMALISNDVKPFKEIKGSVRLPLWIPDIDASGSVVIPTPRADRHSVPGIYPRPLSSTHPHNAAVLKQFRLMGRLFAAALRDRFMFPLPLSASFLRLVQDGNSGKKQMDYPANDPQHGALNSGGAMDNFFNDSNCSPKNNSIDDVFATSNSFENENPMSSSGQNDNLFLSNMTEETIGGKEISNTSRNISIHLNSRDLPRPGFLGGEIVAAERYICEALDKLDEIKLDISRTEFLQRQKEIACDRDFARVALGKSYDCSFEEYFEDKCFVDPLDPTQGDDAVQLCHNGSSRSVTIDNIREWTALAKQFFLYDGVIAQAMSFREGVGDFFSPDALRLFTAEELQRDICGGGDNVDRWDDKFIRSLFKLDGGKGAAEALIAVAAMGGEGGAALSRRFGPTSPTVGYLVKALLAANSTRRRQFLSFVTSVPIVTPGQIEVVPVVNPAGEFLPMSDPACLPRANTCSRRLYLPKFESYAIFSTVLWAVVREESKFKGFYEWTG